ncbi:uncharacterized protein LOC143453375 isoform X4 [Clavelina lepadiformis]|uniref:uncharacterized protein LOC143453375 isoform X4 n=1 Tax=Clavelina lepadiformis TaxID=159417 RepID=UPI0040422947
MSKPEEQRLTEDKLQLVQPDDNEESSSGESDEQPGTSRAVAIQAGMPHDPDSADAGNQVLQTMENAEASQGVVSRIDPGLIELARKMAESRARSVMIINAPQFNLRDERRYQDNREYSQMDIRDSKNITPTRVKVKQTNPLDSAKRSQPSIEQQDSANNPFDPPQLNTQPQDPSDVTQPKQTIKGNPQVEPHTDISEVTNQSNALNTEIPFTNSGNVAKQPTICRAEKKMSGVLGVGEITTTTRVFATVLEGLRRSDNTRHSDITALILQISRLAYNATKKSTVVITPTEMEEEGLSTDDVQDIIVALHAYSGLSQRVFDGDQKYFFSHQMFQECFTAWYFISQMSLAEFQIFVTNEAFADEKWSVIRRFICGLLIDMLRDCHGRGPVSSTNMQTRSTFSMKGLSPSDVAEKRRIWIEALKSQLVRFENLAIWSDDDNQRRYISLLCELNESSDMELFNMASQHFPTRMSLYGLKLSSSEAAIFCDVLRKQQKELKKLHLSSCFSPGDVERLISAISEMPEKVKRLYISGNTIKDIAGPEFFTKIEEYLGMEGCFEVGRYPANSSEKQKIQLALDQLQYSWLRVRVGDAILTPRNYC